MADVLRGYGGVVGGPAMGGTAYVRDSLGPWRHDAKCRDYDTDVFFPSPGETNREAKKVCADCPVRSECLQYALLRPHISGIWGATSERERERIRWERRHP